MYLDFVDEQFYYENSTSGVEALECSLEAVAAADLCLQDRLALRPLCEERVVTILTQPVTFLTVQDVLMLEACALSIASNCSGLHDVDRFLKFMTLWCVTMYRLGVTATTYDVIVLLDVYGSASRDRSMQTLELAQDVVLRKAAEGRALFGKNTIRVYSYTFDREM